MSDKTEAPATPTTDGKGADRDRSAHTLEEFKYAIDQAAIVAITDQRGIINYVNDKFCEISKFAREELLGRDHRIINSGLHPADFFRDLWRTIAQGRVWRGEIRNRAKDGSLYWVDTTIVPLVDARNRPRQYLAIRSDITARKLAESRLLEQQSLAKLGELAAMVAHEVRNPLAGLKGSLQVLQSRLAGGGKEHQIVGTMVDRLDSLNDRVNDILKYAGTSPPHLEPVTLWRSLTEAASIAKAAARSECPLVLSGPDCTVQADPNMLRDVFVNLLLNAYQASAPRCEVSVTIEAIDGRAIVRVADRGPGIPRAIRDRVFEPFVTTKPNGTGLGLAIVKRLLDRQGGGIAIGDRSEGGTMVVVTLPLATG
jgi:two-component system CheB/CheR fusion protein